MGMSPVVWAARYSGDARAQLRFVIARVDGVMQRRGDFDCEISFEWARIGSIATVDPMRQSTVKPGGYPSLTEKLGMDPNVWSVPLSLAVSTSEGRVLWDGHHRLESYRKSSRTLVPAWLARFSPGAGEVKASAGALETGPAAPA